MYKAGVCKIAIFYEYLAFSRKRYKIQSVPGKTHKLCNRESQCHVLFTKIVIYSAASQSTLHMQNSILQWRVDRAAERVL